MSRAGTRYFVESHSEITSQVHFHVSGENALRLMYVCRWFNQLRKLEEQSMYLTRAFLDPSSRHVCLDARSPEGLHKRVMQAFPDHSGSSPRAAHGVLHRLDVAEDGKLALLMQSRTKPNLDCWPAGYLLKFSTEFETLLSSVKSNPAVMEIQLNAASLRIGKQFHFRLRANTTRKVDTKTGPDGRRRHGRRVPVRGDRERLDWLHRHAAAAGFSFLDGDVSVSEVSAAGARRDAGVTVAGALFDGVLSVADPELLCHAMEQGVGPAKAYGFGLLSVKPVR